MLPWIHQIFIQMILFIGISTLAYWSVKIPVTIHLPRGSTSKQTFLSAASTIKVNFFCWSLLSFKPPLV